MRLLTTSGDFLVTSDGDFLNTESINPIIDLVNNDEPIRNKSKSVTIVGSELGNVVKLTNNANYDASTIIVTQTTLYAFSTFVVFDVVPGDLEIGEVFVFNENGSLRNETGVSVSLVAEIFPESTVSTDAAETLTSQFSEALVMKGFLSAILKPFDDVDSGLQYLNEGASFLHGAIGTWLDSEGKIIGAKRGALSVPSDLFFTFGTGSVKLSRTQGFNAGYLRSVHGNELSGTVKSDSEYLVSLRAKALATFSGTALADVVDFVYNLFGTVCFAEFGDRSDAYLYPEEPLTYEQKIIVKKYAPITVGSKLFIV